MAYSLMDAAALVPSPYEDEPGPDVVGASYMSLSEFVAAVIVPKEETRQDVARTFGDFVQFFSQSYTLEDDTKEVTIGALKSIKQVAHLRDEAQKQHHQGESLVARLIKKGLIKVVKWVLKKVFFGVVRIAFNAFRSIITWGIEGLMEWLVRPVLMEVLGFIGLNPELWPLVAAIGGLAALGYGVYKMFFEDKNDTSKDVTNQDVKELEEGNSMVAAANTLLGDQSPYTGAAFPNATGTPGVVGAATRDLGALISRGEGGYNSVNRGAAHGYRAGTEDLEHMTVGQVMQHQAQHDFNAVGRYQIIGDTLKSAVKALGLTGAELFNKATQDMIFEQYLIGQKRHQMADYISGKSDNLNAAVLAASQEWASVAAPPGAHLAKGGIGDGYVSYYAGTANNRASISAFEMAAALQAERAKRTGSTEVANTSSHVTPSASVEAPKKTGPQQAQQAQANQTAMPIKPTDTEVIKVGKQMYRVAA